MRTIAVEVPDEDCLRCKFHSPCILGFWCGCFGEKIRTEPLPECRAATIKSRKGKEKP